MRLVLICGGRGTRLTGRGDRPSAKALIEVAGRPLFAHLAEQLAPHVAPDPVVVVSAQDADAEARVLNALPSAVVVRQPEPNGVAAAVALARHHFEGPALVALGDLVLAGRFTGPLSACAITVWVEAPPAAVRANFGVRLDGSRVQSLQEKPSDVGDQRCGLGVYALDDRALGIVSDFQPYGGGERGITPALQQCLSEGVCFQATGFEGDYINVNTPDDLEAARRVLS